MNRRRALKSVLAFGAAAPISIAAGVGLSRDGKPEEVTVKLDRDAAFTMLDKNNAVWQRMFDDLLPKPGTFEWAMVKMREGCVVELPGQFQLRMDPTKPADDLWQARSLGEPSVWAAAHNIGTLWMSQNHWEIVDDS